MRRGILIFSFIFLILGGAWLILFGEPENILHKNALDMIMWVWSLLVIGVVLDRSIVGAMIAKRKP